MYPKSIKPYIIKKKKEISTGKNKFNDSKTTKKELYYDGGKFQIQKSPFTTILASIVRIFNSLKAI